MMNTSNHSAFKLMLLASVMVLNGCGDRVAIADQAMADIRNQPAQPVEPPPQPQIIEDFIYSANSLRSPFIPPGLMNMQSVPLTDTGVRPD